MPLRPQALARLALASALASAALAPACTPRKDPPPDAASTPAPVPVPGSATPAPGSATPGTAAPGSAPAASAAPGSAPPVAIGLCDLRWGFHGKVAGQDAYLRLVRDGDAIVGRYFYAKHGVDLPLRGALGAALELELTEGDAKAPTGRFTGRCDPKTGALDGTWSNGKKDDPFHFDRVASREKPLVATKRRTLSRKAKTKTKGPPAGNLCEYEQLRFELFGAGTPEAELALNEQDAKTLLPKLLSKEIFDQADKCEEGIRASFSAGVVATFRGFVTVESSGTYMAAGAAHPANAVDFSRVTYDLGDGRAMGEKELFAAVPKALLARCVAAYVKALEIEDLDPQITGRDFDLRPAGVHFFGKDYPHVIAALTGAGPTVRWEALLRDHALRADSPAKRAWDGVKPAAGVATDATDCLLDPTLK